MLHSLMRLFCDVTLTNLVYTFLASREYLLPSLTSFGHTSEVGQQKDFRNFIHYTAKYNINSDIPVLKITLPPRTSFDLRSSNHLFHKISIVLLKESKSFEFILRKLLNITAVY